MKNENAHITFTVPVLFIRTNKAVKCIPFENILYLQAEGSYTYIFECGGTVKHLSAYSLGHIEQNLRCPFILRVHRSYMVNLKQITGMISNSIKIGNNIIPIGRTYKHILNNFIII